MTAFDRHTSRISRRKLLQAGAAAAALGTIPGPLQRAAQAQGAFDWKKFKGETIEVLLVKSPRGDILTKYHKEFEDLTGMSVGSEMIPEQQQRQKAVIEFNSGNPSFDVIAISYHVQKRQFAKNNWLADLRPMMNDKALTDPNLDFNDFAKGGLNYAVEPDGRVNSLPFNLDPWVVYYNKELFDAKGIAFPKTFAEMTDAAAKLNDPGKGVSGFVGRGLKNANVPVWSSFLLGYGGGFIDKNGKLTTDTATAKASRPTARKRDLPGSTFSGPRTRPTRRGCCKLRPARRCARPPMPPRKQRATSRRRSSGSNACSRRQRSRSLGCR